MLFCKPRAASLFYFDEKLNICSSFQSRDSHGWKKSVLFVQANINVFRYGITFFSAGVYAKCMSSIMWVLIRAALEKRGDEEADLLMISTEKGSATMMLQTLHNHRISLDWHHFPTAPCSKHAIKLL